MKRACEKNKLGLLSVVAVAAMSTAVAGVVLPAPSSLSPDSASLVSVPAASKLDQLKNEVQKASKDVAESKEAVARAEAKLPAARKKLADAQARESEALAKREVAIKAHEAALRKVAEQKTEIAKVQAKIDEINVRIGAIARHNYISGNENVELDIILETQDPAEFAIGLESVRRVSRVNAELFEEAARLKADLNRELKKLQGLEDSARDRQAEADQLATSASASRSEAQGAKQSIDALVVNRNAELAKTRKLLKSIEGKYERLLAASMGSSRGFIKGSRGVNRSPREAVAWAMKFVGNGAYYDNLCLKFVDDAYGANGSRVGRAIDQWYRALGAGKGHPGDRNPPIGAQVFWHSGNPARHIALYAGGGMVISTGADYNRVGFVSMSYMDSYGPYIGWAEPYYP